MEGIFYILQSETTHRYYIGSCTDIERRLAEHARGHTHSTRKRGPWILRYSEKYLTLKEARNRERQVKKWKSRKLIEILIEKNSQEKPR